MPAGARVVLSLRVLPALLATVLLVGCDLTNAWRVRALLEMVDLHVGAPRTGFRFAPRRLNRRHTASA